MGAPSEDEAILVLQGVRERYEKFHAVSYTDEAIRYAVYLSSRYIPDRFLPDKAIDLIDEAGARVKLRQATLPDEVAEVQKRVKFITHRMETAIANHEFEKARFYSEEERKEKENLRAVRERLKLDDTNTGIVTREDIEDVVARWTGIAVTSIKEDEQQKLLRIEDRTAQARHQPGQVHYRAGPRHSPQPRRTESPGTPRRMLPVPRPDRRRQDGSRAAPRGIPVRQREIADPLRHVRIHGEALRLQTDRRASRLRGIRRGRPVDRARAAHAVFGDPAR